MLSLACCELQELSYDVESWLEEAGLPRLPRALRKNVDALATKIWTLEAVPGPRRDRQVQQARMMATKCAAHLTVCDRHLPRDLYGPTRELLEKILGELDRLQNDARNGRWLN